MRLSGEETSTTGWNGQVTACALSTQTLIAASSRGPMGMSCRDLVSADLVSDLSALYCAFVLGW